MSLLEITNISKAFGDTPAIRDISLSIEAGEFFALLGASGSGKSTLLRILAGFDAPDSGRIRLNGEDILPMPVYERPINMMHQSYALFPHMSVADNIAFGLKQEKCAKQEITERTAEALAMVQLTHLAARKPRQLSGGERQRCALARSLIKRPKLLLLDEPLAALDKRLREQTQFELVNLQERLGMTFIMVTHDQEEAMTMASRIAMMDKGEIAQVGSPQTLYESPATRAIANFIGDINIFEGRISTAPDATGAPTNLAIHCADAGHNRLFYACGKKNRAHLRPGGAVGYAIRPEKITITKKMAGMGAPDTAALPPATNHCTGRILEIAYLGNRSIYHVKLHSNSIIKVSMSNDERREAMPMEWEDTVVLTWPADAALLLTQ